MTQNIRRVGILLLALFALVSLALPYWQIARAPELLARPDNARPLEEEARTQRGRILSADGQVLAETRRATDGTANRVYAYPPLASTVGYWSPRYSTGGLESARDLDLRGLARLSAVDVLGLRLLHSQVSGNDVALTVDLRVQKAADEALGTRNGAIVVLNANTGAVVALASHPYIDPNRLDADWTRISSDPARPLINRATQGLYTPGSTFKTVTLAAALETGKASPTSVFSYTLRAPDRSHTLWWHQGPSGITCANHPDSHMPLDLAGAYSWSCNVAFAEIGLELGPETYADYAARFGLGSAPPLEIPVAASQLYHTPNYLIGPERFYALASTAFGQGELAVTPLQMALIAATVANEGIAPRPYLVAQAQDAAGNVVDRTSPGVWRRPITPQTASLAKTIMAASADWGWARTARVQGVAMGGKTGTAETGDPSKPPHAWFVGWVTGPKATYAIAVVKENAGYGSDEAATAAKKVLEAALK